MGEARVGFAVATEQGVCLGDPENTSLWLHADGIEFREYVPRVEGYQQISRWTWPWQVVDAVEVDAEETLTRKSGLLHTVGQFALGAVGGGVLERSDPTVTVHGAEGKRIEVLAGFVGTGYWRGDLSAIRGLLAAMVEQPDLRPALADGARVLAVLADVGRDDAGPEPARQRIAELLG